MIQTNSRGVLLYILPSRTGGTVDFDLNVTFGDIDFYLIDLCHHGDRRGRCVDPSLCFGGRDALDAMHTGLILQPGVSAPPLHLEDDFLIAADADRVLRQDLGLPTFVFGVTHVHAEEIRRKNSCFIATRAGANFHDDVPVITRVFGYEQPFDLLLERLDLRIEL